MSRYQNLAQLPQTAGYRFVALGHDGMEVLCRLVRGATGDLKVAGVPWDQIRGWRPA